MSLDNVEPYNDNNNDNQNQNIHVNNDNKKRKLKNPMLRLEYLSLLAIVSFLFIKQLRIPLLESYTGYEINFKTPAVFREREAVWEIKKTALVFEEEDEPLVHYDFSDSSNDYESHDSHDVVIKELTPAAMKLIEDYTYYHSHFKLTAQADECKERVNLHENENLQHVIDSGWCPELQKRKFLIITFNCDDDDRNNPVDDLMHFLRSIAWALVTDRTIMYKTSFQVDTSHCTDDCSSICQGIARVDPWMPHFDVWNQEYEWISGIDGSNIPTIDVSQLDKEDSPVLAILNNPPPLSLEYLYSETSREKAKRLIDWGMAYGMILDECIQMEEPDTKRPNSADDEYTNHYSVEASAKCTLDYQPPCVIFQVGETPISIGSDGDDHNNNNNNNNNGDEQSSLPCRVENTSKTLHSGRKSDSKHAMFHTLARAGNGWNGASLDIQNNPLSELLLELLKYRGRLHHGPDFRLKLCTEHEHNEYDNMRNRHRYFR